jgi:hypothetical protein
MISCLMLELLLYLQVCDQLSANTGGYCPHLQGDDQLSRDQPTGLSGEVPAALADLLGSVLVIHHGDDLLLVLKQIMVLVANLL